MTGGVAASLPSVEGRRVHTGATCVQQQYEPVLAVGLVDWAVPADPVAVCTSRAGDFAEMND
ncbi:MAG: hypothetical protein ACKOYM_00310, partial [Actinomycetes bacterium]